MKHKEVKFENLKKGAKFYHERQLCIKMGPATYYIWSSGASWPAHPDMVVRPVKASVRIFFYSTGRK